MMHTSTKEIASVARPRDQLSQPRVVSLALVSLLVAALVGSVLVPALETRRIMRLLREITEVIEPARLVSWQLEAGLAMEYSALQGYALSGDSVLLHRYRMMTEDEASRLAALERLAPRLGPSAVEHTADVRRRITRWQELNRVLVDGEFSGEQFAAATRAQRALRDSIMGEIDRLPSQLSAEAATRSEQVRGHEWSSLFFNAVLVFVALTAVVAAVELMLRERRLAAILQRRVEEESALRQVARALSAAATIEEAMRRIVEGPAATTRALGAYVEFLSFDDDTVRAAALGPGVTTFLSAKMGRSGSLTDEARARHGPTPVAQVDGIERRLPPELAAACANCTGLVVPLLSSGDVFGALAIFRDATTGAFGEDERRQMELLGDLASAVLRRVEVERTVLVETQHRATYETALRTAAEALAAAFTVDDVTQQIARSALDVTQARGVYAQHVGPTLDGSLVVVVRGEAGSGVPTIGTTQAYVGSYAEQAIKIGKPVLMSDLARADPSTPDSPSIDTGDSTIVLPLGQPRAPIGALFIVGAAQGRFRSDAAWAHTFSHLAALAYEKVRLLDEARESRLELERLMRSRQRIMRGFSHDVKNPLGAADGYAELLSAGVFGELAAKQRESIQRIRRSIRRALDLIDDLHELARAETGNVALRSQVVDLGDLARTSGDEYRGAANASGLSLTVDVAADLPPVETDGARVRQIVGNLLSNAIKYTKTGSVVLRVREYPGETIGGAHGWVHFDVIDTGLGIPADKRDIIFEEFSRLGAHDRAGAGLGLAISKRLAEALGGQIIVESEVGRGSTFILRLPIHAPEGSGLVADTPQGRDERRVHLATTVMEPERRLN
jgi:signal transduction histidine kinase/GAF domain-containing protein/CHASE3 domain sensor protein